MTADRVALIDWDETHVDVPDLDLVLPHNAAGLDDDTHDVAAQAWAAWEAAACWDPAGPTSSQSGGSPKFVPPPSMRAWLESEAIGDGSASGFGSLTPAEFSSPPQFSSPVPGLCSDGLRATGRAAHPWSSWHSFWPPSSPSMPSAGEYSPLFAVSALGSGVIPEHWRSYGSGMSETSRASWRWASVSSEGRTGVTSDQCPPTGHRW